MNTRDAERVRADWQAVEHDADRFVSAFYERLFRIDPKARSLFAVDMDAQRQNVAATLRLIVDHVERPDELRPQLVDLGRKHAQYGIEPDDFEMARIALLETLEAEFGERFDERHRRAWEHAYDSVTHVMIRVMEDWRRTAPARH